MLREVTSKELSEWQAYYNVKERKIAEQRAVDNAKAKAKTNNR